MRELMEEEREFGDYKSLPGGGSKLEPFLALENPGRFRGDFPGPNYRRISWFVWDDFFGSLNPKQFYDSFRPGKKCKWRQLCLWPRAKEFFWPFFGVQATRLKEPLLQSLGHGVRTGLNVQLAVNVS